MVRSLPQESSGSQCVSFGGERRRIELARLRLGPVCCPLIIMPQQQPFDLHVGSVEAEGEREILGWRPRPKKSALAASHHSRFASVIRNHQAYLTRLNRVVVLAVWLVNAHTWGINAVSDQEPELCSTPNSAMRHACRS